MQATSRNHRTSVMRRHRATLAHLRPSAVRNAVVGAIGRLLRASSKCLIKVRISNGLVRKQTAPAFKACVRMFSSSTDVMKIIGTWHPWIRSCLWSSTPAHSWHFDIHDQAGVVSYLGRSQEFIGRREGMSNVSQRSQKSLRRLSDRCIIIDDGDHRNLSQEQSVL